MWNKKEAINEEQTIKCSLCTNDSIMRITIDWKKVYVCWHCYTAFKNSQN